MSIKEEINDFITISKVNEHFIKNNSMYKKEKVDSLSFLINLKGSTSYKSYVDNFNGSSKENHTTLSLFNSFEGSIETPENYRKFLALVIRKEYLSKILPLNHSTYKVFDFFETKRSGTDISYHKTRFKTQILANEIFSNKYNGNLEKIYQESKVLELLYIEFENIFSQKDSKSNNIVKISKQDKEALYYARDILIKNIQNPPTIKELSQKVAINEFKLKYGFNKFFNQTPYNLSLEYRLYEAKNLLENSEFNINEISSKIGYKYVQSFSKAFVQKFGIRPKDIMKNRKYYY